MPARPLPRPFVTANFAVTWDARISTRRGTSSDFSSPRDKRRLVEIRAQCDAGDVEALWRTAHSLKSSAAALGAARLSRRCAQIETLARESGAEPVCDLLDALEADLVTAQNGLRELIGADHG